MLVSPKKENLLMRVKKDSKNLLETQDSRNKGHGIQSCLFKVNRWGTMETVTDFIFFDSKITAGGECSHEIKRRLLLGRKAMTNIDSILKSRDTTNKGLSSQSYGFSSSHVWK